MIKFPTNHIAESVVNRILMVAEGLEPPQKPVETRAPATSANVPAQSALIDQQAFSQPPSMLPPLAQVPNQAEIVQGKPTLPALLEPEQ